MALTPPATVAEFKAKFTRAFVYGVGREAVRDSDITGAFSSALAFYNPALWGDADLGKQAFLFASAHFVAMDIQASGGLAPVGDGYGAAGRSAGFTTSKSVGSVSASYAGPPPNVVNNPVLMQFWETEFGKRYVAMLAPRLVGVVAVAQNEIADDLGEPKVPFAGP